MSEAVEVSQDLPKPPDRVHELLKTAFDEPGLEISIFQVRQNSRLYKVRSKRFPHALIVKECLHRAGEADLDTARGQFNSAERVASRFRSDPRFGVPKAFPMLVDQGLLVTEWIEGRPMSVILSEVSTTMRRAVNLMTLAGLWLRRFHETSDCPPAPLDALHRMSRVSDTVELAPRSFSGRREVRRSLVLLEASLRRVEDVPLHQSWLHGDFTTDNLLVTGDDRVVGIDFSPMPVYPGIFDVEQFLIVLDLDLYAPRTLRLRPIRAQLMSSFRRAYYQGTAPSTYIPELWLRLQGALNRWGLRQAARESWLRRAYFDQCYARITARLADELDHALR